MRKSIMRKRLVLLSLSVVLVGVLGASPGGHRERQEGPGERGQHDH